MLKQSYPLREKSKEQLLKEMNEALKQPIEELSLEEEIEEDAEYGYFQEDEDDYD